MKKYCPRCSQKYDDRKLRFCLEDGALLSLPDSYRLVGSTLDGKYQINALVGIGGFGAVYHAHHLGLNRPVAFKILQPNMALQVEGVVELFESEAKTAAQLLHENIVMIFDAGRTIDGIAYIAMEWLEGRALDEELAAHGRLSFERTAEILRQVVAALAVAHAKRTVHRDLKPSNVMIVKLPDGGEQVKIVDFGIAKVLSSARGSDVSRVMGTPHYASPEQLKYGAQIDGRADIYALGVMLYEMLTGKLPFNAPSVEELIRLKLNSLPPPLCDLLPDAPTAVGDLLLRMMVVDPQQRPQKVSEVPALFEAAYKPVISEPSPVESVDRKPAPAKSIVTILASASKMMVFETVTLDATGKEIKREKREVKGFVEDLGNGVSLEMVEIPAGTFTMGSPENEAGRRSSEGPQHSVSVSAFAMGKYTVTQAQWREVVKLSMVKIDLKLDPSGFKGDNLPVEQMSWDDAVEFCERLSRKTGRTYRLPSEAEWEYAARAGTSTPFAFGPTITPQLVNYHGNYPYGSAPKGTYRQKTIPVGSLGVANAFGLYDMHGNVWEWCQDWYDEDYYKNSSATDPRGPSTGSYRVYRGGGWYVPAAYCRSANRLTFSPGDRNNDLGFRLVRTPR